MPQSPFPDQPQPSGQYGYRSPSGRPTGYEERPVPGEAQAPVGPSGYGRTPTGYGEPTGYGGPQTAYGRPPVEYGGVAAPTSAPADSSSLPSGGAPIPVTQESVVIRAFTTGSSRLIMLIASGFGLVALAGAVHNFFSAKIGSGVILVIIGSLVLAAVMLLMTMRTTLDATGVHIGSTVGARDIPWPASRTGLFVRVRLATGKAALIANNAQAMVVTPEGKAVPLTGLTWMGPLPDTIEAKGVAEIDRIWQWAVARGYTHETGWYIELRGAQKLLQIQRRKQEERYGLV